jgi:hypothetical protein
MGGTTLKVPPGAVAILYVDARFKVHTRTDCSRSRARKSWHRLSNQV